jgi:hypothetical protein
MGRLNAVQRSTLLSLLYFDTGLWKRASMVFWQIAGQMRSLLSWIQGRFIAVEI